MVPFCTALYLVRVWRKACIAFWMADAAWRSALHDALRCMTLYVRGKCMACCMAFCMTMHGTWHGTLHGTLCGVWHSAWNARTGEETYPGLDESVSGFGLTLNLAPFLSFCGAPWHRHGREGASGWPQADVNVAWSHGGPKVTWQYLKLGPSWLQADLTSRRLRNDFKLTSEPQGDFKLTSWLQADLKVRVASS